MRFTVFGRAAVAVAVLATCVVPAFAQGVTDADLSKGLSDPAKWLVVSGTYDGQRLSPLTQITPANAGQLAPVWTFQAGVTGQFEATPVVLNGILYVTGPQNHAWAIDGKTGKQIWHYQRTLQAGLKVCCGPVNRGFAVYGNKLFMTTLDAHILALDPKDGKVIWDTELADFKLGYASTVAPLVVKGKLIVGMAGGEYANRGFLDAYDPETGKRLWRFWTIPAPGEPGSETWPVDVLERGGSPTWVTGTYDAELNTIYWGTGNPNPDWDPDSRKGDNLYAASVVALDPDTGKLKWHFQYTPNDGHDWDANQTPVLANLTINGQPRKVLMQANRNGFLYILDRTNGTFINAWAYGNQNWASGFTPAGRPIEIPGHRPTAEGTDTCPDWYGNTNFMPPSYDAQRGVFVLTVRETCAKFIAKETPDANVGDRTMGGTVAPVGTRTGALRAVDPLTGARKWEVKYDGPGWAGVMATASGVVFSADHQGTFMAVDSNTGKLLYSYSTGAPIFAAPTTYMIDGRQYVFMPSGLTATAFALPASTGTAR